MKRIKIVGLCLIAVFALGAMIVSAAQAAEYGRCVLAKGTGGYTNAGCTTKSATHKGGYEWEAGPGPKAGYTSKTGIIIWKHGTEAIECLKSTAVGKITGPKTGVVTITREGCRLGDESEQNIGTVEKPAPDGIVVSNLLATRLIGHGEKGPGGFEPKEGEVWTEYVSAEHEPYLEEYEMLGNGEGRGVWFRVSGSLSAVTTPVNKMTTSFTTEFARGKGEQNLKLEKSNNEGSTWIDPGSAECITEADTTTEEEMEIKA